MKIGCLFWFLCAVIAGAKAAAVRNIRNIPVEVVYESPAAKAAQAITNLEEKVKLEQDELVNQVNVAKPAVGEQQENTAEASHSTSISGNAVRNLDEKIQLSPDELGVALKHLPTSDEDNGQLKLALVPEESDSVPSNIGLINTAREVIYLGLNTLKQNIDKYDRADLKPSEEAWKSLNSSVEKLIENQQQALKQNGPSNPSNQNQIIQNIVSGFQNFTANFVQNFQQNNRGNGSEDEQQSGGFAQNFINSFSGGAQQIINTINNLNPQSSTSNTVLGDTGSPTTESGNVFQNVIQQIQQIFTGQNSGNPSQSLNFNQSDTGVAATTSAPGNFIQGAISQFNQVVNNFRPPGSSQPSGQEDANTPSTTPGGPFQIFQSIGNQIGNAFNQAIVGASTSSPSGSEDEGTSSTQSTNFIQNIGQAFQNINPFRPQTQPQSTQAPTPQEEEQSSSQSPTNPVSQIQAIGTQIQQLAGGSGNNPIESFQNAISGAQNGSNPIQSGAEAVGTQIQQLAGGSNNNPVQSIQNAIAGAQNGSNPFQSGAEAVGTQIQQLAGGSNNNPVQGIQNAIQGANQNDSNPFVSGATAIGTQIQQLAGGSGNNPVESIQNAISQNGSNPFVSGAETVGTQIQQLAGGSGNNPVESIQNAISQNGSNPFVSGATAVGTQIQQLAGGSGNNPIESIQNAISGGSVTASPSTESARIVVPVASSAQQIKKLTSTGEKTGAVRLI